MSWQTLLSTEEYRIKKYDLVFFLLLLRILFLTFFLILFPSAHVDLSGSLKFSRTCAPPSSTHTKGRHQILFVSPYKVYKRSVRDILLLLVKRLPHTTAHCQRPSFAIGKTKKTILLVQDNLPAHKTQNVLSFFQNHTIVLSDWPGAPLT